MTPPPSSTRQENEEQELAQRTGGSEPARPSTQQPTTPSPTTDTSTMGQPAQSGSSVIEKTASVDLRTFERRFEDELGGQDLTLAAAFDVPGESKMRMFVVAPKDLDSASTPTPTGGAGSGAMPPSQGAMEGGAMPPAERGAMGGEMGGGGGTPPPSDSAGGTTPRPQPGMMHGGAAAAGGQTSKQAQSALQKSRLVIAYTDENQPDQVKIAYMKPAQPMTGEQPDQKLHAAIDRIVGEGSQAMPPDPKAEEERRG